MDIVLWLPRPEEQQQAIDAGLADFPPDLMEALIDANSDDLRKMFPGRTVKVYHWPVADILALMQRRGLENTPDGRAQAFAELATS